MSMIRCDGCDSFIDTDECVDVVFEDVAPFRHWCFSCVENAAENEDATSSPRLAALKKQDPEVYADLVPGGDHAG